jgi:hypothetical protein
MTDPVVPDPVSPATPPAAPQRRRRRWPWAVLGFVVTLLLLALAAPTLMSVPVARQYVLGRINRHLNGRLDVGEWSLGWTGTELRNVQLFDAQQSVVFSVARLKTELTFWDLMHGQYDLGDTLIEEPNFVQLVVARDGSTNFQAILPAPVVVVSHRGRRGGGSGPGGITLRGDVTVQRLRGTIVDRRDGTTTIVQPSDVTFKLHNMRDEVPYEFTLTTRAPTAPSGSPVHRAGTTRVPAELASASGEGLPISAVTLAAADALLRTLGHGVTAPSAAQSATTRASASTTPSPRHRSRAGRRPPR